MFNLSLSRTYSRGMLLVFGVLLCAAAAQAQGHPAASDGSYTAHRGIAMSAPGIICVMTSSARNRGGAL